MVKRAGWIVLAFVGGFIILTSLMMVLVDLRQSHLAARKPPTLRDLDELTDRFALATPHEDPHAEDTIPGHPAGLGNAEPPTLPSRLESNPSSDDILSRFTENRPGMRLQLRIATRIYEVLEAMSASISEDQPDHRTFELGRMMMGLGEWDAARRCFWEALDAPLDPRFHRYACAKLAWLEDDPEKALRYLELSCQGDDYWLPNAIFLCRTTGSGALAEHYLARLRVENPEVAHLYEEPPTTKTVTSTQVIRSSR